MNRDKTGLNASDVVILPEGFFLLRYCDESGLDAMPIIAVPDKSGEPSLIVITGDKRTTPVRMLFDISCGIEFPDGPVLSYEGPDGWFDSRESFVRFWRQYAKQPVVGDPTKVKKFAHAGNARCRALH